MECSDIIFHFNKGSIADPSIPPWVIKAKGQTFYIWHLDADIPFSTKESPDHPSTKGAIRFRNAILSIDDRGWAKIARNPKKETTHD